MAADPPIARRNAPRRRRGRHLPPTEPLQPTSRITRAVLRLWDSVRGPVERTGIDYPAFRALLCTYLVLDERRGRQYAAESSSGSPFNGGFWLTCAMNVVIGVMFGVILLAAHYELGDPIVSLGAYQLGVLSFAVIILVTDFSAVLVDDSDAAVVAPLPLGDRTLFAARIAHITTYTGLVIGSLALPGLVIGSLIYPPLIFVPVFVVTAILTALLALALAFGLLLLALRTLDVQHFQGLLLWVQVGVTVVFVGGMQVVPHVIRNIDFAAILQAHPWVPWIVPPCHQGGLLALALGDTSARALGLAALGIALPLLAFGATVWLGSGGFLRGLTALATAGADPKPARRAWIEALLRERERRAGYAFARSLSRRERQYRLRTYPLVAVAAIVGIAIPLRDGKSTDPALLCAAIYLLGLYTPLFLLQARYSESWQGRWVLQVAPLERPGRFGAGGNLAIAVGLLPVFTLVSACVVAVGGMAILPDVVLATELMLVIAGGAFLTVGRHVPFTDKFAKVAMGSVGLFMIMGMAVGMLGLLHMGVRQNSTLKYGTMVLLLAVLAGIGWRLAHLEVRVEGWKR